MPIADICPRPQLVSFVYYPVRPDFVSNESRFATWVLVLPETGRFHFETDGAGGVAEPGTIVIIPPRARFSRGALSPISYHVLTWEFMGSEANVAATDWPAGLWDAGDAVAVTLAQARLRHLAGRLDSYARQRGEHILQEILFLALESRASASRVVDPAMNEAARLLRDAAGTDFSMRFVSDAIGLKPVQFTRRFKAAHGINPVQYLTAQRLEIAQQLLINSDLQLDEIARRCGWSSGFYLSHVFSTHRGMSPGHFRRLHRP